MPELPEVETTCRGLSSHILGRAVKRVEVRNPNLRWPVSPEMAAELPGRCVLSLERRAKYLIIRLQGGALILHLGMSGSIQVLPGDAAVHRHDHVLWHFGNDLSVRFRDHRRFGAVFWTTTDPLEHPLLKDLGPEPLSNSFDGTHLFVRSRGRRVTVKAFIMDARTVAGIGNIYAAESLHRAGIHPARAAGRISRVRYDTLVAHLQDVLRASIDRGGTTLRDYVSSDGGRGHFVDHLDVYGRAEQPCRRCGATLRSRVIAQRSTVYCPNCQH